MNWNRFALLLKRIICEKVRFLRSDYEYVVVLLIKLVLCVVVGGPLEGRISCRNRGSLNFDFLFLFMALLRCRANILFFVEFQWDQLDILYQFKWDFSNLEVRRNFYGFAGYFCRLLLIWCRNSFIKLKSVSC